MEHLGQADMDHTQRQVSISGFVDKKSAKRKKI